MKKAFESIPCTWTKGNFLPSLLLGILVCGFVFGSIQKTPKIPSLPEECIAGLRNDTLTLANANVCRKYRWNQGNLIGISIENKSTGQIWMLDSGTVPDFSLSGLSDPVRYSEFHAAWVRPTASSPGHLRAEVLVRFQAVDMKRVFRIYPGCPAIACDFYFRTSVQRPSGSEIPTTDTVSTMERLCLPGNHWNLKAVEFTDRTDVNNTLVRETSVLVYRRPALMRGNILFAKDVLKHQGIFVLKEAPCSSVQLRYPGYDFSCRIGEIRTVGMGVGLADLNTTEWIRAYGFATGVCGESELDFLQALRTYQENVRVHLPARDDMIMMNTWGDRNRDSKIGERFILAEIDACKALGITHFQIDDGWQKGLSVNSARKEGNLWDAWNPKDWAPHPERFPKGLQPVAAYAKKQGVEIGLWFHPSTSNGYANWELDADVVIGQFRQSGVRYFKIDGVKLPDKRADANLRKFFDKVVRETDGAVVFNLDATADNRGGYHYFNEYGNTFLENRYTDWMNYYPYWTLRNLWMLSKYVPPQNLQIEFLNTWRNAEKYPMDDPLAPSRLPFEYVFAIAMAAQPLAWFEGTGLPEEARRIAPLIRRYRAVQSDIHSGKIFPIGDEPSGNGWTGFQAIQDSTGYLLIFRERNPNPKAMLRTWLPPGKRIECETVLGQGLPFTTNVGENGSVEFSLPDEHTFTLYRYFQHDR